MTDQDEKLEIRQMKMEISKAEVEVSNMQRHLSTKQRALSDLKATVEKMKKEDSKADNLVGVSQHALIRYIERVKGVDVLAIMHEMLTPGLERAIIGGANTYKANGVTYIIEDNTVVTVKK